MPKKYIAIAGNMGVGKSTLVDFLCRYYKLQPFYEPNDFNPYLEDFYKNMKKWAFHSQIYFLTHKFRIHQELDKEKSTVIQDRTIYEDAEIFCKNLYRKGYISVRDYTTYNDLYQYILRAINPPDLMIYLKCTVKTVRKRIKLRGRKMEQNIPAPYLKSLDALYDTWIRSYNLSPVLTISTEKLDYIGDFLDRGDLLQKIEKYL